jgi:hypothetical protein
MYLIFLAHSLHWITWWIFVYADEICYGTFWCSFPHTENTVSYKNQLMHTYIIHTTLLALCYSNIFWHSKGHLQGAWLMHFHSQINKMTYLNALIFVSHSILQTQYLTFSTRNSYSTDLYDSTGIHGLTCASFHLNYVGQSGQSLKHCYSECVQYIRYNNPQAAYTNHILQHAHEFDPIQNTMTLIHRASKGCLMDIMEHFFIRKYDREHKLILEQIPGKNNPFLLYFMAHKYVTLTACTSFWFCCDASVM